MGIGDVEQVSGDPSGDCRREGAAQGSEPARGDSPAHPAAPAAQTGLDADQRLARLIRTIEGEIVPRLVISRRLVATAKARTSEPIDAFDVDEAVRLLLNHDVAVCSAFIAALRDRGASLEMICLDLLAPAARRLGRMWEEDECDFLQVTVGLCRMHQVLRELSPEFQAEGEDRPGDRRILLATCPGEQHTFGLALVAQFLRRAGWDVWHEFLVTKADILDICGQHSFAVVGLSLATEDRLETLADTIGDLRRASRNKAVGVLVGGPLLVARPSLAPLVGADATAANGALAVVRAEHMFCTLTATN
jgi:MerR family transcriptional regulator, light-induced transcriptional regulator